MAHRAPTIVRDLAEMVCLINGVVDQDPLPKLVRYPTLSTVTFINSELQVPKVGMTNSTLLYWAHTSARERETGTEAEAQCNVR
jgi:hypothetical protein